MSYVFYDVETTGLRKRYDQIVSFAAVLTDNDLNVIMPFETRARLSPHILPSPGALLVTGASIGELARQDHPHLFDAVAAIYDTLLTWSPSLFLGYNSLRYDEEVLRHSFFQHLKPAFLTVRHGNARADVLGLARITAALRPDVLRPALAPDGSRSFRLAELAAANGLAAGGAHTAAADVQTTLAIARHIKRGAPDLWSQFQRFASKPAVESFIANEKAFVYFDARAGGEGPYVVMPLGLHSKNPTCVYCLDLSFDLDRLVAMDDMALATLLADDTSPLTKVATNKAPMMAEMFAVEPEHCSGLSEDDVAARIERVQTDPALGDRLLTLARGAEREFPVSPHVEDQLYGYDFPSAADEQRMADFHANPSWDARAGHIRQFEDARFRRLAQRIVYLGGETALPPVDRDRLAQATKDRFRATDVPWLTVSTAAVELAKITAELAANNQPLPENLVEFSAYLSARIREG